MEDYAEMIVKRIVKGFVILIIGIAVFGGIVLGTQWLWNTLVPSIFGGPVLNYWQTLGLMVLAKLFLWPISKGGGHWGRHKSGFWQARWERMSPEQRERLKARMRDKWCGPMPAEPAKPAAESTPQA